MPVTAAEVAEARAFGQAALAAGAEDTLKALNSTVEVIAYTIHAMQAEDAPEAEVLDMVELLLRAGDVPRGELREMRDLLARLAYPRAVTQLLTQLARRAKPSRKAGPQPPTTSRTNGQVHVPPSPAMPQIGEAARGIALLRPVKRAARR